MLDKTAEEIALEAIKAEQERVAKKMADRAEKEKAKAVEKEARAKARSEKRQLKEQAKEAAREARQLKKAEKEAAKAERKIAVDIAKAEKAEKSQAKKQAAQELKAAKAFERQQRRELKAKAKEEAKAARVQMPTQNGQRRPRPGSAVFRIWELADNISQQLGQPVPVAVLLKACRSEEFNDSTVRTQYARWRTFNGVSGRITLPMPDLNLNSENGQ